MIDVAFSVLKILFAFTLIIGVHELGHAIAAMICGVEVKKFSIGFGPGWTFSNVPRFNKITLSPIALGGYVMLDENQLDQKSIWKKFFILSSGMLGNIFLAIILFALAGVPILKAIIFSLVCWLFGWILLIHLLSQGVIAPQDALAGPIGVTTMIASSSVDYLMLLAFLNLGVATFNLLPLPPLDGGRMFIYFLGIFFEKKWLRKIQFFATICGAVLMIFLLIATTIVDISKL